MTSKILNRSEAADWFMDNGINIKNVNGEAPPGWVIEKCPFFGVKARHLSGDCLDLSAMHLLDFMYRRVAKAEKALKEFKI